VERPQHFFPYFDVVKTDWPAELRPALEKAATDRDETEFYLTLRRMLGTLQDGHVTLIGPGLSEPFYPAVRWDWIEEQLAVVRVGKEAGELVRPGDVVLKIDGRSAPALIAERTEKASGASLGFRRRAVMMVVAAGKKDSPLELEVQSGSSPPRMVALPRTIGPREFFDLGSERRPSPLTEIKPGVWYIDVTNAKQEDFEKQIDKFAAATGLIFDVRGYPRITLDVLLGHLLDKPITAVPVYLPVVLHPDRRHMTFFPGRSDPMEPKAPRLKAKVVFLTDARAISAAETYLAVAEHYHLGAIIGSPTAGTNGNVRVVSLPGGYEMQTTGIKVLQFDGSPFHGRGVPLTRTVKRTVRGAAEERDEVLEEALKELAG
jgi:C-terminal processing protease CtpA/Prc